MVRPEIRLAVLWAAILCGCSAENLAPDLASPKGDTGSSTRPSAFALPQTLDLGGSISSIRVADLDEDDHLDLAALVGKPSGKLVAVVAWGAASQPFVERWSKELPGSLVATPGGYDTRGSSSAALVLGDVDQDQRLDLVTAQGWFANEGARTLRWNALPDAGSEHLQPVALVASSPTGFGGAKPLLVRGRVDGVVEQCEPIGGRCALLPDQQPPCDPMMVDCAIEDLAVADFDSDGKPDVLAGGPPRAAPYLDGSTLWLGGQQWQSSTWIEGLDPVDYEVGDLNGDGHPDVVAQQREFISDFPSLTHVWLVEPGSATLLNKVQTIYNADNHTDNAELADVDGDGCLDLLMIGVDADGVHLRLGNATGDGCTGLLGDHDPAVTQDVGWKSIPAAAAIGIQQLDVNGDNNPEWVLRQSPADNLRFMAIPETLRSGSGRPPQPAPSVEPLTVELVTVDGGQWYAALFVPVEHEGKPALMMLDTGAATSFLYLGQSGPTWSPDAGEVSIGGRAFRLGGRSFDSWEREDKPVVGVLGADLLLGATSPAALAAELDLRCGRLTLHLDGPAPTVDTSAIKLEFDNVQGHIIAPARVDGSDLRLMLDTGSQDVLWLGEPGRPGDTQMQTTDVEGTPLTVYVGFSDLELAGQPARSVPVMRAPRFPYLEQTIQILGGNIDGLLGISALGNRWVSFRKGKSTVWLEPPASTSRGCGG